MKFLRKHWRVFYVNRYFTPSAPNDVLRSLLLITLVLSAWSWAMNEDYKDQINQEQIFKESYRKIMTNCMTQAENGGNASFTIGQRAYSLDCTLLTTKLTEGIRK